MVKLLNLPYLHLPFVSTILGSGNGRNNENQGKSVRPSSSMSTLPEEEDLCSHCGSSSGKQKSRKWSCYSIIFLLAVDAFTIGLVLVLFSHHNYHTGNYYDSFFPKKNPFDIDAAFWREKSHVFALAPEVDLCTAGS